MAKKEIKKQTIEEILAEHTPTSDARNTMKLLSFGCIEIISIQRNG